MKKFIIGLWVVTFIVGCKTNGADSKENDKVVSASEEKVQESEEKEGQYLFDGKDTEGWRAYNEKGGGLPDGWIVEDRTLKSLGKGGDIGGDIVYGKEEFAEFELSLEWKIAPEGNSGIFYHVVEGEQYEAPYFTGPEYQIRNYASSHQDSLHMLGADYGMYTPTYKKNILKNTGEWNTSRIRFTNEKVTYWLNDHKTVEFVPWSVDWKKRKSEGKWRNFPDYGEAKTGLIGLQDHGSEIWFRNIKIKKL